MIKEVNPVIKEVHIDVRFLDRGVDFLDHEGVGREGSDGRFWSFREYYGLTVPQTLRTWSLLVTVQSVVGLAFILLLGALTGGL